MSNESKFTNQELRILAVLSDGYPHKKQELLDACEDPMITSIALQNAITRLRKKLNKTGTEIISHFNTPATNPYDKERGLRYRHVRLISRD